MTSAFCVSALGSRPGRNGHKSITHGACDKLGCILDCVRLAMTPFCPIWLCCNTVGVAVFNRYNLYLFGLALRDTLDHADDFSNVCKSIGTTPMSSECIVHRALPILSDDWDVQAIEHDAFSEFSCQKAIRT